MHTLAYSVPHLAAITSSTLPWVAGRGLGVAALLALAALTVLGLWLRHPWHDTRRWPRPDVALRSHAVLAAATLVLVAGHVGALVLDPYAGVGWQQALLPGTAHYRPQALALGSAAVYLGLLVGLTAALAGRLVGRAWLPVHRVAVACFALAWAHGVLAGSDTTALRLLYAACGAAVVVLAASRRLVAPAVPRRVVR